MEVTYTIDWFSYTVKDGQHTRMGNVNNTYVDGKGMNGYSSSLRFLDGRIENSNPDRLDMGTQVVFSGSALRNFSDMYSKSTDDVLSHYACLRGKCTRIDIAIDVRNSGLDFVALYNAIEAGEIKTKTPRSKIHYHRNFDDHGWTIYIGKKSKHRFMRIYHKGRESGTGEDWIRFELQCNTKTADRYFLGYVDASDKGKYVKSIVNGFIEFTDLEIWNKIVGDEKITISPPQEDGSKTLDWLYNSVAKFLGRYIAFHGDDVMIKFMNIVNDEREKALREIVE